MNLTRAVIHEIIKQPQSMGATPFLSSSLLPANQQTVRLTQILNNAFSKDDSSFGNFEMNQNNFYENFQAYQDNITDGDFLVFTQRNINDLSATLSTTFLAKGGFFVFCEYNLNNTHFLAVYLVRDVEGILFNKDNVNHTFQINEVRYLDTNKLSMGGRINIDKLSNQDNNHIALTKSNQGDVSEYFVRWIGVTRPESNADFTNKLFNIISSIPRPINPETGNQYDLNELREVVYNHVKSLPDKIVNLRDIGTRFFDNENALTSFAEANRLELDYEFRYDGRALNKFKRITANRDGIRLSFARGDLDTKVSLSTDETDLVTIRSRSLADSIRQQIVLNDRPGN